MSWPHLIVVPVVLPLMMGALLVLLERAPARTESTSSVDAAPGSRRSRLVSALSLLAVIGQLVVALLLTADAGEGRISAYLLGNWQAPFGISLVLDRLSALMLVLTAVVALACLLYARGGDEGRGQHFHALFQFQLMGLNGAFLTADLFNLFVFFEVLLIASYGLLLHGAGAARLKASIHYVVFNLAGSGLFLIAVSLIFALTGTLNMADLAQRVAELPVGDRALIRSAALLLLVVFCVKAALLPLYFWLPQTYGAATAPVAALFAIMTKVGVYTIARVYTLIFGSEGGVAADVAWPWLAWLALATAGLGAAGALAARRLRGVVSYLLIGSAGTLLLALGLNTEASVSAGLFYLVHSTLMAAALFLLVDRIGAARGAAGDLLRPADFEGNRALLGGAFFVCAVAAAGLPPLAGFLGKALLMQAAIATPLAILTWLVLLANSLGNIVAVSRAGSTVFWRGTALSNTRRAPGSGPRFLGTAALVLSLPAITALAGPLHGYTSAAAAQLFERQGYISAVLDARPVPPADDVRREMRERDAYKDGTAPVSPGGAQ